jgi:hypothetical protein
MLTPDKIAAFNKLNGTNLSPNIGSSTPVSSRYDEIMNIGKQPVQPKTGLFKTATGLPANAPGSTFGSRIKEAAQSGLDVAKGFGKGLISTSTGPIAQAVSPLSRVPAVLGLNKVNTEATNTSQKVGKGLEFLAEMAVPVGKLAEAAPSVKAVKGAVQDVFTPVATNVRNVLEKSPQEIPVLEKKIASMFSRAKEAMGTTGTKTPLVKERQPN